MEIVFLLVGLILGFLIAWFYASSKFKQKEQISPAEFENLKTQLQNEKLSHGKTEERLKVIEKTLEQTRSELQNELNEERKQKLNVSSELSAAKKEIENLNSRLAEQLKEYEEVQKKLTNDFKVIANQLLDEKSQKFTEQNKANLDSILKPLGEKIKDFEKKVDEVYINETKDRATLKEQLKMLQELNQQMTKEASNLTNALKGQAKTQGNWGEMILEKILERSGLNRDKEYSVQESVTTEEGKRFQPDVIIKLPENKAIIIDSKVSLLAYEKFVNAEDENERGTALKEHIQSVRNHVKNLSGKNYQNLYGLKSLDFVLLFMPIESAFGAAVQNDNELFNEAFDRNIVLVSPSTLLATLRTIANIWRYEYQNKNALQIAEQGGKLYDKFVAFVEDLKDIGSRINATQTSYDKAFKKLTEGRANIISQAEKLKELGAKTSKSIDGTLLNEAEDE